MFPRPLALEKESNNGSASSGPKNSPKHIRGRDLPRAVNAGLREEVYCGGAFGLGFDGGCCGFWAGLIGFGIDGAPNGG
jgi:hypothetical protein